jgi:hypothetical protein
VQHLYRSGVLRCILQISLLQIAAPSAMQRRAAVAAVMGGSAGTAAVDVDTYNQLVDEGGDCAGADAGNDVQGQGLVDYEDDMVPPAVCAASPAVFPLRTHNPLHVDLPSWPDPKDNTALSTGRPPERCKVFQIPGALCHQQIGRLHGGSHADAFLPPCK